MINSLPPKIHSVSASARRNPESISARDGRVKAAAKEMRSANDGEREADLSTRAETQRSLGVQWQARAGRSNASDKR
jgi:hypothetical protein